MRTVLRVLFVVVTLVLVPASVRAQGAITGVVKDASGAVLPGVTVEAASPVLIEKVRSVVSDDTGQYRIVDLRPGTYSVTFTLPGLQHREARRHRADRHVRRDRQRRPEGRRARGDDHRHRRNADRRRPEREGADDDQQGRPRRHPDVEERHRHQALIPGMATTGDSGGITGGTGGGASSIHGGRAVRLANAVRRPQHGLGRRELERGGRRTSPARRKSC